MTIKYSQTLELQGPYPASHGREWEIVSDGVWIARCQSESDAKQIISIVSDYPKLVQALRVAKAYVPYENVDFLEEVSKLVNKSEAQ